MENLSTFQNISKVNHQIKYQQRLSKINSNSHVKKHTNTYTNKTFNNDESKDNETHKDNLSNKNTENNERQSPHKPKKNNRRKKTIRTVGVRWSKTSTAPLTQTINAMGLLNQSQA